MSERDPLSDLHEDRESREPRHDHSRLERFLLIALGVVIAYAVLAYVALPALWTHHEHQRGLATCRW